MSRLKQRTRRIRFRLQIQWNKSLARALILPAPAPVTPGSRSKCEVQFEHAGTTSALILIHERSCERVQCCTIRIHARYEMGQR